MSGPRQAGRRYDARSRQLQAQQNRDRVLAVASRLFIAQGYAATSIEQIAAEAGLSVRTVFAGFTSKINLLKHVVDTAVVGDSDQIPLHQRPSMRAVHDAATAEDAYERLADTYAEVAERGYGIYAVVHGAADADPDIAELERHLDTQRLTGVGHLTATFAERLAVTDPAAIAHIRDTLWTLGSPLQYRLLVQERGWTRRQYRDWIARALAAMIPPPQSSPM
jgi:AcrR family transcriptional regulator